MKKVFLVISCWCLFNALWAQSIKEKLQKAYEQFESDSQLKHAISSLYVINAKTGEVVFDKNSQVGLAPASTQKIITATTAFELLGKDYRYKTQLGYDGKIEKEVLKGNLFIAGGGDPTLGSWRFSTTRDTVLLNKWLSIVHHLKIKKIEGDIIGVDDNFETQITPGTWIWDDIGNYYGAGVSALNWRENQYDLKLSPGKKEGDSVEIIGIYPEGEYNSFINELRTGPKGSGDNGYIYLAPYSSIGFVRGTVPLGENPFTISGSFSTPSRCAVDFLGSRIKQDGITISGNWPSTNIEYLMEHRDKSYPDKILATHYSPPLDSIIYWFLQKSINLYGEALIKTFAYEKRGFGATDTGIVIVKDFWKQKGLDENELNIYDGSGLSPLNRVTTHAEVEILKYARQQPWFSYFFNALPEYNNIKMKSGSISDVKSFCGYHTSGDGTQYIFSFIVNNYNGSSSGVVKKMYKVLDSLK